MRPEPLVSLAARVYVAIPLAIGRLLVLKWFLRDDLDRRTAVDRRELSTLSVELVA
jgi:hypothetical protein